MLSLMAVLGEAVLRALKPACPRKKGLLIFRLCVYLQYSLDVNGLAITIQDANEASAYPKINLLHWQHVWQQLEYCCFVSCRASIHVERHRTGGHVSFTRPSH